MGKKYFMVSFFSPGKLGLAFLFQPDFESHVLLERK